MLADGRVREEAYYGALARVLGLPFLSQIDPATISDRPGIDSQLKVPRMLRCHLPDRAPAIAIVPSARELMDPDAQIRVRAGLRERVVVTCPSAIRKAVWDKGADRRVDEAANRLFDTMPQYSARIVFSGMQGFLAGSCVALLVIALLLLPALSIFTVHIVLSSLYLLALVVRGFAAHFGPHLARLEPLVEDHPFPVYTVLVALYHERAIVGQLVDRLGRLNWPRSRLDIKLICEASDPETIEALQALDLGPEYEIVIVPDAMPRTKPKALNYGLAGARGRLVAIYDAEDRPHPDQLREAWQRFRHAPSDVACLQAPLHISNARQSWLSALFALEYAVLFRRLLPLIGHLHLPMPLGGTSNHFRIEALRKAGAWDAYNVTEDADLGLRLHRLGYRAEMIGRPTIEDAPTDMRVWFGQRSRWLKGWMQTWLVLMRDPARLARELGPAGSLVFHVLISGMLISALGHPLIILFLTISVCNLFVSASTTPVEQLLFVVDGINTAGSYMLFAITGRRAMTRDERRSVGFKWRAIPLYWLMISQAAWQALVELHTRPFFWKKTPHVPSVAEDKSEG